MPNFAAALKREIRRLARKEIKAEIDPTKQSLARHRREINELKHTIRTQAREIARLRSQEGSASGQARTDEPEEKVRFSSRSVRAQRSRLELSAADYGKLIGVSGLTVYNWEHGKSRPRRAQLAQLVAVRGIGKREARARLDAAKSSRAAGKVRKLRRRKPR